MGLVDLNVDLVTDASGNADVQTPAAQGHVVAVWIDRGDMDSGADFTITEAETGVSILHKDNVASDVKYLPRTALVDTDGAAIASAYGAVPILGKARVQVAQGGAIKTGKVVIYVDGDII